MYRYLIALIIVFFVTGVHANVREEQKNCLETPSSADPRIQAQIRAIHSQSSDRARAIAFYLRGTLFELKGDLDCAMTNYNTALELNPQLAEAYFGRGAVWAQKGNVDRALGEFNSAINAKPRYPAALRMKGVMWRSKGDLNRAIANFDRAIQVDASYWPAIYDRGKAWSYKRDYGKAITDYNEVISLNPRLVEAYVDRGDAWDDSGDSKHAIADYTAAIRIAPNFPRSYRERGVTLAREGDYDGALSDFDTVIRLDPNDALAYKGRGRVHFYQGKFELARDDFARSQQLSSDPYATIWLYLAVGRSGGKTSAASVKNIEPKMDVWPMPVLALFMGKLAPDAVLKKAASPDPMIQRDQMCEADFYIGQWRLSKGQHETARTQLRKAAVECPREFVEKFSATIELKRLEK